MVKRKAPIKMEKLPSTTGIIKETAKKKPKQEEYYIAKVGCWNCNSEYEINILKGFITTQYIVTKNIYCKGCGCDTLKSYNEYKNEKKIMKDVMLHHRIEHSHEEESPIKKDHHHIG